LSLGNADISRIADKQRAVYVKKDATDFIFEFSGPMKRTGTRENRFDVF
jgi:hypothetical protein